MWHLQISIYLLIQTDSMTRIFKFKAIRKGIEKTWQKLKNDEKTTKMLHNNTLKIRMCNEQTYQGSVVQI